MQHCVLLLQHCRPQGWSLLQEPSEQIPQVPHGTPSVFVVTH
jgi:hypothetical protein